MKWRLAVAALAVLLVAAGVRLAIGFQEAPAPLVYVGHVDIGAEADGKLLVLIDINDTRQPSDGLVDQVFRFETAPVVSYSGPATVTYVRGRATVQVGTDSGWVFSVIGRQLAPPPDGLFAYQVTGISHMWGDSIHQPPAVLFASLSSTTCSKTKLSSTLSSSSGDPSCKNCQTGGPGVQTCSMDCGGGSSCSADCDENLYACCSCNGGCGCCGSSDIGGAHH